MFIRIVISAKIGKDYKSVETYTLVDNQGVMGIQLPRDMDISKPFTMICEPDPRTSEVPFGTLDHTIDETPLSQDISEIPVTKAIKDPVVKKYIDTKVEKEAKKLVPRYPDKEQE
jgi:hypothetical protein